MLCLTPKYESNVDVIYIDFVKIFDKINRKILFTKLIVRINWYLWIFLY